MTNKKPKKRGVLFEPAKAQKLLKQKTHQGIYLYTLFLHQTRIHQNPKWSIHPDNHNNNIKKNKRKIKWDGGQFEFLLDL